MYEYECIEDLQQDINDLDFGITKRITSTRLVLFTTEKDRFGILEMVADIIGGKHITDKSGSGWRSSAGAVQVGKYTVMAKPTNKKGSTNSIHTLSALSFMKEGLDRIFLFHDKRINVRTFFSAKGIEKSIIQGCTESDILGTLIANQFKQLFSKGQIDWDSSIPISLINKLGVYVGELLIGWSMFRPDTNKFIENNTFTDRIIKFHVPLDSAHAGIDSFLETKDTFYSISSKFGKGAGASFFANILTKAMEYKDLKFSILKDIVDTTKANNLSALKAREIVYNYALKNIYNLPINPNKLYLDVVNNRNTTDVAIVSEYIKRDKRVSDTIRNALPKSISAAFNRVIVDQLSSNKESVDQIIELLEGKDYWQANLNPSQWLKGKVSIKMIKASKARLKLISNKSAVDNPACNQGFIAYELFH